MEISSIGVATAFAAGVISLLSPCVLPLVPGYISYVAGRTISADGVPAHSGMKAASRPRGLSLCFVVGFSTVFVLLGASATALGGLLRTHLYEANLIGGVIVVIFGLFTTGLVPMPWLDRDVRFHSSPNSGGRLVCLFRSRFRVRLDPMHRTCAGLDPGPIRRQRHGCSGTALLAVCSLGLGPPFILAVLFMRGCMTRLLSMRRTGRVLKIVAGGVKVVMVVMAIAMITGHLSSFAIWLLRTFPALGRIG